MAKAVGKSQSETSPWVGFGFIMAGSIVAVIALALPNASLHQIESDLGLSQQASELSWTLCFAALAAFLVPAGQVADRIGRVRLFILGSFGLAVATALAGLAPTGVSFLSFRVLQGVAIGMLFASGTGVVNAIFPDAHRRGIAFAIFGLAFGLGFALGPIVGAAFLGLSWNIAFYAVALLAAIAAVATMITTRSSQEKRNPEAGTDVPGAILLVLGLSLFLIAIDQGSIWGWLRTKTAPTFGGWEWPFQFSLTAAMLLVTIIALGGLVIVDRRRYRSGRPVLVDPAYFRIPSYNMALIAACLLFFALIPLFVVFPLVSQILLGQGPMAMALTVSSLGVGIAVGSMSSAPIGQRLGSKLASVWSLAVSAALTMVLIPIINVDMTVAPFAVALFFPGIGIGVAYSRMTELILTDVPVEGSGHASGIMFGARSAAGAIGSVVLTAIVTITVVHSTPLLSEGQADEQRVEASAMAQRVALAHPAETASGTQGMTISDVVSTSQNAVIDAQKPGYVDGFRFAVGLAALIMFASAAVTAAVPISADRTGPVIPSDLAPSSP